MPRHYAGKKLHFRIGRNIDGEGVYTEADINDLQPAENERNKGRIKRRIEMLKEKRELMEDLLEVWYR